MNGVHPAEYVLVEVVVGFAQIWRGVTRGASSMIRHCRRLELPVPLRVLCTQCRRRSNSHSQLAASRAYEAGVRKEVGSQKGEIAVTSRWSNVSPSVLRGGGRDILEQTLYPETLTAGDEIRSGRVWSLAGRDDPPPVDHKSRHFSPHLGGSSFWPLPFFAISRPTLVLGSQSHRI
jgi:hypothetical protein